MEADLKAMYTLQMCGIDMKISGLYVTTDNKDVHRILRETYPIIPDIKNSELCLLLRILKRYYKYLLCSSQPREKMHFPDSLLKYKESESSMEHILASWSHLFAGLPLFPMHQSRKKIEREYFFFMYLVLVLLLLFSKVNSVGGP